MEREKLIRTVTAAQSGDSEALNALFNEFYNDVYYFALKTVKDSDLACDITQETFVEIINTLGQLQEPAAFVTWMKQITYHQCTRYFKKKKDVLVDEDEEGNTIFDTLAEEKAEFIPDEALDQQDFRKTILGMIDQLSEEQRAATMLYYFDELSVKQIAEIQGCSEGTVKSRLNYARKSIKASVEDYEKKNGVKLHCVGVLPLLLWLWNASREAMPAASAQTVAQGVAAATGTTVTASIGTAASATVIGGSSTPAATVGAGIIAKLTALPLVTKIVAAVLASSLVLGGTVLAIGNSHTGPAEDPNFTADSQGAAETEPTVHEHIWINASCQQPKTCSTCGKSEGSALGHQMQNANYQKPASCTMCDYTEGEALIADFQKYNLTVIDAQMGMLYDYKATTSTWHRSPVGHLWFSDYVVFPSDEEHEAAEGYEWHSVTVQIYFDDWIAYHHGVEVKTRIENYYDIRSWEESETEITEHMKKFTVNMNGMNYEDCIVSSTDPTFLGWVDYTNTYYCRFSWRVPIGYDGFVLCYHNDPVTGEREIYDFDPNSMLLFRFPKTTVPSPEPDLPTIIPVPAQNPYVNEYGQTVYVHPGGEWVVSGEKGLYYTERTEYIFDVTPATIRAADWNSWDFEKQMAFDECFPREDMTPEVLHNYFLATKLNDYDCGYEGHACMSEMAHNELVENLNTPCYYCGELNCISFLQIDEETLFTTSRLTACPKYDPLRDPSIYCQICKKPKHISVEGSKYTEVCTTYVADTNCHICGLPVKANLCHTCNVEEDIYDEYTGQYTGTSPVVTDPPTTEPEESELATTRPVNSYYDEESLVVVPGEVALRPHYLYYSTDSGYTQLNIKFDLVNGLDVAITNISISSFKIFDADGNLIAADSPGELPDLIVDSLSRHGIGFGLSHSSLFMENADITGITCNIEFTYQPVPNP